NKKRLSLPKLTFSLLTNIHFNDIRSFIRNEIPGYANYYSNILIAGEGTNLSNIPKEPSVSLQELQTNPKVDEKEINKYNQSPKNNTPQKQENNNKTSIPNKKTTNGKKVIFIYHTHSSESFFSILHGVNTKNANLAISPKANVSLLGRRLATTLEAAGIGSIDDHTDINQMLLDNHLKFGS